MLPSIYSRLSLRPRRRRRAAGSTLPATMMVIAVILSFLSAAAYLTSQDARFAGRQASKSDLLTAADAALEYAYSQWKASTVAIIHGNQNSIPASSTWTNASPTLLNRFNAAYGSSGTFAASTGVNVTALSIGSTDQNGQNINYTTAPTVVPTNNVPGYPGWSGQSYNYVATATVTSTGHYGVTISGGSSDNTVTVKRYFQVTTVPLFQAAIFYENDLEIHPGAKMVVTGLVHTNANLYALGIGAQVQFMNNVSYVGNYSEGSNPAVRYGWDGSNTNAGNTPENINALYNYYYHTGLYPDLWKDGLPSTTSATRASQVNQVSTIDPFGGASQSNNGLHDLVEVPATGTAYSDQIAYNNASLHITIDNSGTTDATRYAITDGNGNALTGVDRTNVLNALKATPSTTMVDQREGNTEVVTSLDMGKLAYATMPTGSLNSGGEFGTANTFPIGLNSDLSLYGGPLSGGTTFQKNFQGTVYVHYNDHGTPSSTAGMAVRLVNGRKLGQDVSIASDNGMYIQGDYNTGGSVPADVPTNTGGTTPQASNYNRHSSAVMADAVTILSNSWADTNAGASLSGRVATATTVNTAILAGDVPSNAGGDGIASGGAHNFPRFLEDWGPQGGSSAYTNFTYTGSLVEAFHSEKFTGSWQTNNVYRWPNRLWSFDTVFLQKQPPGVPTGIQFSRGRYERVAN